LSLPLLGCGAIKAGARCASGNIVVEIRRDQLDLEAGIPREGGTFASNKLCNVVSPSNSPFAGTREIPETRE